MRLIIIDKTHLKSNFRGVSVAHGNIKLNGMNTQFNMDFVF